MALKIIANNFWKHFEAHPETLSNRDPHSNSLDNHLVLCVNGYHAYCIPCQMHLYTRHEPSDHGSQASLHLNSNDHRVNAFLYPKNEALFRNGSCLACEKPILINPVSARIPLKELVAMHVAGGEHHARTVEFFDHENTFLSALAHLPPVAARTTQRTCKICSRKDSWESVLAHIKTKGHLQNLRQFLKNEFQFDSSLPSHLSSDRVNDIWMELGRQPSLLQPRTVHVPTCDQASAITRAVVGEPSSKVKKGPEPKVAKTDDPKEVKTEKAEAANSRKKDGNKNQPGSLRKIKRDRYYRGVLVRPTRFYSIKDFICEGCDENGDLDDLPRHLDSCILMATGPSNSITTEECSTCKQLIIFRKKSFHCDSEEHKRMQEKADEEKLKQAEAKSKAQTSNLVLVKILIVTGVPATLTDKLGTVHATFKKFGKIVKVSWDAQLGEVTVQYWLQSSILRALNSPKIVIQGSELKLSVKELKISGKDTVGKVIALADEVVQLLLDKQALEEHCWQLSKTALEIRNDPKEKERTDLLLDDLLKGIKFRRGETVAVVFGSRDTGLTLDRNSDIDVFTGTWEMFYGREGQNVVDQKRAVQNAASWLHKSKLAKDITSIVSARVPIVTFTHRPSRLKCDLSFRNGLSVRNTDWQCLMMKLDERVRPMVMYMKEWIRYNGFTVLLTSYAAAIMVFVYLAKIEPPVLPTLKDLRRPTVKKIFIGDWDTSFQEDLALIGWKSQNNSSVVELLTGFFHFFAELNYEDNFIYPARALILPRKILLNDLESQPIELRRLNGFVQLEDYAPYVDMCIMDPFDFSHNLTKRIRSHVFQALVECLRLSSDLLAEK